jgi:DNA gyrase/topoisomerase IV subunit A
VDYDGNRIVQHDSAVELIKEFAEWRLEWYERRYQLLHDNVSGELVYWKLLAALFRAGFTKKLGTFANRAAVEQDIEAVARKSKLVLGEGHLDRAVSLPTYRWTKDFEAEVGKKISELETELADYRDILSKPERRRAIYISELEDLKKMKL